MYSLHQALLDALPLTECELRLDRLSADEHAVGLLAVADQEVFAWLPYPAPTTVQQMRRWIEAACQLPERRIPLAVLVQGQVAGTTSYYPDLLGAHAEIGSTWFGKQWWGRGLNARTKRLLLDHAFGAGCLKVRFRTDISNRRSQRAIERLGAHCDGVLQRDLRRSDGTWRASVYYSLLHTEWLAGSGSPRVGGVLASPPSRWSPSGPCCEPT